MAWRYYDVKFIDGLYYYRPTSIFHFDMQSAFREGKSYVPMPNTPTLKRTEPDGIELYICTSKQYEKHQLFGVKEEKEEEDNTPTLESLLKQIVASNQAILDEIHKDVHKPIYRGRNLSEVDYLEENHDA